MNILKPLIPVFFLALTTTVTAQSKLALANECFEVKAYYLATRYYQQVFTNSEKCHPDQVKLAQALAAIDQQEAAAKIFQEYSHCEKTDPQANIHYGKFLMGQGDYEKAITVFERAATVEPDLSRHYILACQMALPKAEPATPVLVKQTEFTHATDPARTMASVPEMAETTIMEPARETPPTAMIVVKEPIIETPVSTSKEAPPVSKPKKVSIGKSPYGVRLGTYSATSDIPDYNSLLAYGEISKKEWSGRTIVFLTGFASRADAEVAVKQARSQKFKSATLVKKQASGRMKSVRD